MLYRGFYVRIAPARNIQREKKDGTKTYCDGFKIEIFSDSTKDKLLNSFTAAVGFEILKNTTEEAEQFAKDVIEVEGKKMYQVM